MFGLHFVCMFIIVNKIQMQNSINYNLQVQQYEVKMSKTFLKVFSILPGPNKSFIIIGCYRLAEHVFVHIDQDGVILHQYSFKYMISAVGMVNKDEIIIPETRQNQITVINLLSHKQYHTPFNFMNEESDMCEIFTFSKSKNICIVQRGMYNDNRLRLSYFTYPISEQSQPNQVFQSDSQWNHQHLVKKGNQQSMIIWFKLKNEERFQIKTFEVVDKKGVFNHYSIKNQIGLAYGFESQMQTAIISLWQIEPLKFFLACMTQKTNLCFKNKSGVINNNFVWDLSQNKLRETKFFFDFQYNDNLIDINSFGEYSVFRTFSFENENFNKSPVFYVKNKSQMIVAKDFWVCNYLIKEEYPGFDEIVVENKYENSNVSSFNMKIIKVVQSK